MQPKSDSPFAKPYPSPNHGERKDGLRPEFIILHYTGMPTGASALAWLVNPMSEVSCHYFVWENGKALQLVPEARRAWHAGAGSWQGKNDLNSRSIGIEIVNPGHDGAQLVIGADGKPVMPAGSAHNGALPAFPEEQIKAVIKLVTDIATRWNIPRANILAHSDIAPRRKRDPGEAFPWDKLAQASLGLWVEPTPIRSGHFFQRGDGGAPIEALQQMLAMLGFAIKVDGIFGEETEFVIKAFQRHWRPARVDGIADFSTITTLRDVVRAIP